MEKYTVPFGEQQKAVKIVKDWISASIKVGVICGEHMTGLTSILDSIYLNISEEIFSCKITATSHINNKSTIIYGDILRALGHSLYDLGSNNEKLDRLIKYIIFKLLQSKWGKMLLIIEESHNLSIQDIKSIIALQEVLCSEGIEMNIIMGVSVDQFSQMNNQFSCVEPNFTSLLSQYKFEIKPISVKSELLSILEWYDNISEYPSGSRCSYTNFFFQEAYSNGYKLSMDIDLLFNLFTSAYTSIAKVSFVNIPIGFIKQTISMCFKYYGVLGENKYWPNMNEWNECIKRTDYFKYINLYY